MKWSDKMKSAKHRYNDRLINKKICKLTRNECDGDIDCRLCNVPIVNKLEDIDYSDFEWDD